VEEADTGAGFVREKIEVFDEGGGLKGSRL
jgi:hypothetical protein